MSDDQAADPIEIAAQRATMLAEIGRYDEALGLASEALGDAPDDSRLLLLLAWLHLKLGRPSQAKDALIQVIQALPDAARPYYLLSVAEVNLEHVAEGRAAADRALELDPAYSMHHLQVAHFLVRPPVSAADRTQARERIASALELDPENPRVYLDSAEIERALGDSAKAHELVRRGLAIAPEDAELHYLRAVLAGDHTPSSSRDYGGYWKAADQVAVLGDVLSASPEHIEARQTLLGRLWSQVLRMTDLPLILLGVIAVSIGLFMASGPSITNLYWAAGLVAVWAGFRWILAQSIVSRAPRAAVRRVLRGGRDARWRRIGTATASVVAGVGVVALLAVRDAALVRWVLLVLVVGVVAGGVASALWWNRYILDARQNGLFDRTPLGYRTARLARRSLARVLGWRVAVLVGSLIVAGIVGRMSRGDAAAVVVLAAACWAAPVAVALWRVRRICLELGDEEDAPKGVRPSVVGGPVLGAATLALGAAVIGALVAAPWAPSARDDAGVYEYRPSEYSSECDGRPASRISCLQEENQERLDELIEEMEDIDIPTFEPLDLPSITVPTFDPDVQITPAP